MTSLKVWLLGLVLCGTAYAAEPSTAGKLSGKAALSVFSILDRAHALSPEAHRYMAPITSSRSAKTEQFETDVYVVATLAGIECRSLSLKVGSPQCSLITDGGKTLELAKSDAILLFALLELGNTPPNVGLGHWDIDVAKVTCRYSYRSEIPDSTAECTFEPKTE